MIKTLMFICLLIPSIATACDYSTEGTVDIWHSAWQNSIEDHEEISRAEYIDYYFCGDVARYNYIDWLSETSLIDADVKKEILKGMLGAEDKYCGMAF